VGKPLIFLSYSHKDENWKDRLLDHLGVAGKQGLYKLWNDRLIAGGEDWFKAITEAMEAGGIAILLVSQHSLTSDFILNEEVPRMLARRDAGKARVYPIVVEPCNWQAVGWLKKMNLRPPDGRPVGETKSRERTDYQTSLDLTDIAREIQKLVETISAPVTIAAPAPAMPQPRVELAFVEHGNTEPSAPVCLTACFVTDEAPRLLAEIASWKDALLRDPLIAEPLKTRLRKARLSALFAETRLRGRLLDHLSTTTFFAYVFFGDGAAVRALSPDEREQRLAIKPLENRFSKKSERIETIRGDRRDLAEVVARAYANATRGKSSPPAMPEVLVDAGDPIVELAKIVAEITARYIADREVEDAVAEFGYVRTRLRLATDVITGEVRTRSKNPFR